MAIRRLQIHKENILSLQEETTQVVGGVTRTCPTTSRDLSCFQSECDVCPTALVTCVSCQGSCNSCWVSCATCNGYTCGGATCDSCDTCDRTCRFTCLKPCLP